MERFKKTTTPHRLLQRERIKKLHNQHKKNLTKKNADITFQEVIRINQLILKEVSEKLISNTGGVVLDGFGHLTLWKTPEKMKVRNLSEGNEGEFYFNPHSKGFLYLATLFTDVYSSTNLKGWSMDGSFNATLKKKISTNIKNGFKYILMYSLVKSLGLKYRNQNNRKLIKNKKW